MGRIASHVQAGGGGWRAVGTVPATQRAVANAMKVGSELTAPNAPPTGNLPTARRVKLAGLGNPHQCALSAKEDTGEVNASHAQVVPLLGPAAGTAFARIRDMVQGGATALITSAVPTARNAFLTTRSPTARRVAKAFDFNREGVKRAHQGTDYHCAIRARRGTGGPTASHALAVGVLKPVAARAQGIVLRQGCVNATIHSSYHTANTPATH